VKCGKVKEAGRKEVGGESGRNVTVGEEKTTANDKKKKKEKERRRKARKKKARKKRKKKRLRVGSWKKVKKRCGKRIEVFVFFGVFEEQNSFPKKARKSLCLCEKLIARKKLEFGREKQIFFLLLSSSPPLLSLSLRCLFRMSFF